MLQAARIKTKAESNSTFPVALVAENIDHEMATYYISTDNKKDQFHYFGGGDLTRSYHQYFLICIKSYFFACWATYMITFFYF